MWIFHGSSAVRCFSSAEDSLTRRFRSSAEVFRGSSVDLRDADNIDDFQMRQNDVEKAYEVSFWGHFSSVIYIYIYIYIYILYYNIYIYIYTYIYIPCVCLNNYEISLSLSLSLYIYIYIIIYNIIYIYIYMTVGVSSKNPPGPRNKICILCQPASPCF